MLVEKQIIGFYPDCLIEETDEINIFENKEVFIAENVVLKKSFEFPIRTYQKLEADAMNALLSALGRLNDDTSATIQILLRPIDDDWQNVIKKMIRKEEKNPGKKRYISLNPLKWILTLIELIVTYSDEKEKKDDFEIDEKDPIDDE